jgi:hypothetical protein
MEMFCVWNSQNGNSSSLYCCADEELKKCPYSERNIRFTENGAQLKFYMTSLHRQSKCRFEPLPRIKSLAYSLLANHPHTPRI